MRRRVLSVMLVVPLMLSAACSGSDDEKAEPVKTSSAAPTTPEATTPSPTQVPLPTTTPEAVKLNTSVLGTSVAKTADEKAVVDAWITYWDAVSKTFGELEPAPGLDSARGKPVTDTLDYLNELKTKKRRSVGWTRDNVMAISVKGDTALIRDCAENFNFEVDANDEPVEKLVPFYLIRGKLTRDGDRWIVTTAETTYLDKDCRS
jgi:hypothetical protein